MGNSLTDRSQNIVVIFARNNLQRSRDIDLPKMFGHIKLHFKKRHRLWAELSRYLSRIDNNSLRKLFPKMIFKVKEKGYSLLSTYN